MIDYNEPYPEMPPGSPIVCGAEPPAPLYT